MIDKHSVNINKSKNVKKGFTLIEVIAVIAILAIIGAILVPNVLGYRQKAEKSNIQTSAKTIESSIEAYNADKDDSSLEINDETGGISYSDGLAKLEADNLLDKDKIPSCLDGSEAGEVTTLAQLKDVASGNFNVTKVSGSSSTISLSTQ